MKAVLPKWGGIGAEQAVSVILAILATDAMSISVKPPKTWNIKLRWWPANWD